MGGTQSRRDFLAGASLSATTGILHPRRPLAAEEASDTTAIPAPESDAPEPDSGDAYFEYIRNAPEFKPVRQDPELSGRWDTWIYMPWRYRWTIGTGETGGRFCQEHGINGGMTDHGQGPLDWLARWNLRFYGDHTAGKGFLHLNPASLGEQLRDPEVVRPRPVDAALLGELSALVTNNVRHLRTSPVRVAYALDDEISWGSFVRPIPWRINSDDAAYRQWLSTYYGGAAPEPRVIGPDDVFAQLDRPLQEIDFSSFLDRMTWNDSVWANFLGALVECANREDPETPCGFVGGQAPSLWGGYDYAKLMKKVQFLEAYDLGSAQEIARSLNPGNTLPIVATHFHDDRRGPGNDSWLAWHYFAHGNRGMIGWVSDEWFDDGRPRPWLAGFAPTLKELGSLQGPKMMGARWLHNGVALYYSHPSIQISWLLDAEAHGLTWPNRNGDPGLGTSHLVRRAWEEMLVDAGLQYDYLAYDEVVVHGVPEQYRVVILPATYALSNVEARRLASFAERGGTVVADFACGLFDAHGGGRQRGALDALFGVAHDGSETRADFFGGRLWVETDQDRGFGYRTIRELFETVQPQLHQGFAVAERRLPVGTARPVGQGRAVYLNLSPQRYLLFRQEGTATVDARRPFIEPLGVSPWITAKAAGRQIPLEVTAWSKAGRTLVFVLPNVPGGAEAEKLIGAKVPIEARLSGPVTEALDERTGQKLAEGDRFTFELDTAEAIFWSFAGPPPS
jgi:hypothetical protein